MSLLENAVSWALCGLLVGLVARLIVPGQQSMSIAMTIVLGIVGALAGGMIASLAWGTSAEPFSLARDNWNGWAISVLGAVLVLSMFSYVMPQTKFTRKTVSPLQK